jgi:hypothetical protein
MKLTTKYDMLSSSLLGQRFFLISGRVCASLPMGSSAATKKKNSAADHVANGSVDLALSCVPPHRKAGQCKTSMTVIDFLHAVSRAARLRAGVRQACGCDRHKLRDPAADPRRRRAQQ